MKIAKRIAGELSVEESRVSAAMGLLDGGATVPFIARYRKEVTGGLDDTQLRTLDGRLRYLRELDERRQTVLRSIEERGALTAELRAEIEAAGTKTRLEDLYLPYKPRRRTKGQIAVEAGLEPLADRLLGDPRLDPEAVAGDFVDLAKGVPDAAAALEGARFILMERFAEDADLVGRLRDLVWEEGRVTSRVVRGRKEAGANFSDYFEYAEPLRKIPSHRALALFRGKNEGFLRVAAVVGDEKSGDPTRLDRPEAMVARRFGLENRRRPGDVWLLDVARSTWRQKLQPHLETDLLARLREHAEEEAIRVFARNLEDLLLAAPGGPRTTIGLDPGLRTGVKVAVVDPTGKLVGHTTVYPHAPRNRWDESIRVLAELAGKHSAELASIGNGTASRETDRLLRDLIQRHPELQLQKVMVSEAGASVYSASELAAKEFPGLDVTFRGAVSIARRLQDPLAELVKIDPKSIGVGQYQHDVNPGRLARSLDAIVEDCVNAVGVDVNTASAPLLARVSGLNGAIARNIVRLRDDEGPYRDRRALRKVPRMGAKTFELAAGFLRIRDGVDPLDASAVHPEAYPVVHRIIEKTGRDIRSLVGDTAFLRGLDPADFTDSRFGVPTVTDIIRELDKPGRDPRPDFATAEFREGVEALEDLEPGMVLEGVVSNVAAFGAFVDVGVHQDGLVHISQLSWDYVKDPRDVVKAGDVVKVKVLDVDLQRRRIGLTLRLEERPAREDTNRGRRRGRRSGTRE